MLSIGDTLVHKIDREEYIVKEFKEGVVELITPDENIYHTVDIKDEDMELLFFEEEVHNPPSIGAPKEFKDYHKILEFGAKKHGNLNWLEPNGSKSSFRDMHDSMFHHLAESFANQREDRESGLDPLLHLITRAQMMYTRLQREITHKEDK